MLLPLASFGAVPCQGIASFEYEFDSYVGIQSNDAHLSCLSSEISCDSDTHGCIPHPSDYGSCLFSFVHSQTENDDGTYRQSFSFDSLGADCADIEPDNDVFEVVKATDEIDLNKNGKPDLKEILFRDTRGHVESPIYTVIDDYPFTYSPGVEIESHYRGYLPEPFYIPMYEPKDCLLQGVRGVYFGLYDSNDDGNPDNGIEPEPLPYLEMTAVFADLSYLDSFYQYTDAIADSFGALLGYSQVFRHINLGGDGSRYFYSNDNPADKTFFKVSVYVGVADCENQPQYCHAVESCRVDSDKVFNQVELLDAINDLKASNQLSASSKAQKLELIKSALLNQSGGSSSAPMQDIVNQLDSIPDILSEALGGNTSDETLLDISNLYLDVLMDLGVDNDGDGVPNSSDACPDIRGLIPYGGCPYDTDRDGVHDGIDQCKYDPGPSQEPYFGCPENIGADDYEKPIFQEIRNIPIVDAVSSMSLSSSSSCHSVSIPNPFGDSITLNAHCYIFDSIGDGFSVFMFIFWSVLAFRILFNSSRRGKTND